MDLQSALAWITEVFEEEPGRIGAQTRRDQIPGWDSLGTLSLLAALDERFDIHLSEQQIESMNSVGDIVELLRDKRVLQEA